MTGISTVAKIEKGRAFQPGMPTTGASHLTDLLRADGGLTVCPGSGADKKTSWKGQWRFRSTDPWSTVVNRNQLHIEFTSADAAIRAARHVRNDAIKLHS